MQSLRIMCALTLAFGPAISSRAQSGTLGQKFDSVLTQHGIVGGGLSIMHASEKPVEYFHGQARANEQPIDAATAYNWASITKTFTAIAILQLRDRGRLS